MLLLRDTQYANRVVTGKVGVFIRHLGDGIIKFPAGTMAEVNNDGFLVIGGDVTPYRLPTDKPRSWVELITRDEADEEQRSLHIDLNNSFDYCKSLEDRARDAEYEARECRSELEQLYSDLLGTQASIIRITSRITAMGVMRSERMETRTEASPQASEKDCQAAGPDHG
ncbi:hypothetical protein [Paenibacillus hunanensis]|uniref:hypothetical protein n=1 Tax=Paenibacillus hunanensis TaxID=539262 RepID=UPI00166ADC06|nr:hypothetical protein [Paenibacillus hunanensis]